MNEIKFLNPKLIVFDESLAVVPMLGTIAERFCGAAKADLRAEGEALESERKAQLQSLDEHGIQDPLPVTFMVVKKKGHKTRKYVLGWDGRHRTAWALSKDLKTVPVRVVTESEGRALLEATVIGRRHWTKGQRAWLAVTLNPAVAANTKGRPAKDKGKSDSVLQHFKTF